jgi:hypothetical protein
MPLAALVARALAMFGLFYFPECSIAFEQHCSLETARTPVLMCRNLKINVP